MGLFKSKEERKQDKKELEERLLNEFLQYRNLEGLCEKDKKFVDEIREDLGYTTANTIKGSEAEIFQANMLQTILEQNWLIIKLLNDINNKLDK
ncbi:hypothetical protein [Clostridium tetani]|uniref:hypothetical protein n=1 Tax=Clostridium tetani TaxID=1513 RepID=UPI0010274222|nr:hypothetical protein [Clostridium tetani]RXI70504.1 hypothetical protein DP127_09405 [Clostridium tetani]